MKNLQLTKDILYSIMTFQEWEVPTPPAERVPSLDQRPGEPTLDLFTMDPQKKAKLRHHVEVYYRDLLQLDSKRNVKNYL